MFDGLRKGWWYFVIDNNTRMSIFAWEVFFINNIDITFRWCINQYLLLNTFPFLFLQTFLLTNFLVINSIYFFFEPWIFWQLPCRFQVSSYFLSIFWMLWMLFTVSKVTFTLSKTLIMYIAYDTWPNKGEYLNILKSIFLALFLAHNHVEVKAYYK